MACSCLPCSLDKDSLLEAVRELFAARLRQAFDGRTLVCTTSSRSHWWDGLWLPYEGHWTGNNHQAVGDIATISCDGQTITIGIVFHVDNLGPWKG